MAATLQRNTVVLIILQDLTVRLVQAAASVAVAAASRQAVAAILHPPLSSTWYDTFCCLAEAFAHDFVASSSYQLLRHSSRTNTRSTTQARQNSSAYLLRRSFALFLTDQPTNQPR